MNSIPISEILLIIYVLVDDWYQDHASEYRQGKPEKKPEFSDSEMMSVILAMDFIPYPIGLLTKSENCAKLGAWKTLTI